MNTFKRVFSLDKKNEHVCYNIACVYINLKNEHEGFRWLKRAVDLNHDLVVSKILLDDDFAIYISELFVVPEMSNRKIGRTLISKLRSDFSYLTVYALSDEDAYYEKLGYTKVGSVFEVHQ